MKIMWQLALLPAPHNTKFRWDAINTCCFATLRMSYSFDRFFESRKFVKLLFERKQRNAMAGSVVHVAATTEDALEVL